MTSPHWVTVNHEEGTAVGYPHYVDGITITPIAERGGPVLFAVESATPDVPLTKAQLAELVTVIHAATDTPAPTWDTTEGGAQ